MNIGEKWDIYCNTCNKYLFTEVKTEAGIKRENDTGNYTYEEYVDEFICDECNEYFKGRQNV